MLKHMRVGAVVVAVVLLLALLALWQRNRGGGQQAARPDGNEKQRAPVSAAKPSRPSLERAPLRYRRGDDLLRLVGRVLDSDDKPVANAAVRLSGRAAVSARSDQGGRFAFDHLLAGRYFVQAWTDEAAAEPRRVDLGPATPDVILRLHPAAKLAFRVLDIETREPIQGATVDVLVGVHQGDEPLQSGVSDSRGEVKMRGLPPGSYFLVATARGYYAPRRALRPQAGLSWQHTFYMFPSAPVSGKVVDDTGSGVEGATLALIKQGPHSSHPAPPREHGRVVQSDDSGRFEYPVPAGRMRLRATHADYLPGMSAVVESDGKTPRSGVTVVLTKGGSISGRVVDSQRVPEPFAVVRANVADLEIRGAAARQVRADRDGRFTLGGLPLEAVELVAETVDACSANVPFDLARTAEITNVTIQLENDAVVSGSVVNPDGTPIPDAAVVCVPSGFGRGPVGVRVVIPTTADEHGRFVCSGLREGFYELTARRPASNNLQSPWMRSVGARTQSGEDVTIMIPLDGSLVGRVTMPGGAPASDFSLSLGSGAAPLRVHSADGSFELTGLAPRNYKLTVQVETGSKVVEASVVENEEVDVGTVEVDPRSGGATVIAPGSGSQPEAPE